jgi:phospholipase/lecithinase/hemolysin
VLTQLLVGSPELAYTYNMTQAYAAGVVPCANPNEHMFWDAIHPTAVIHMLLAQVVIDALNVQMDG